MDFFEQQAKAHRKTKWLVIYFVLAVTAMILAVYVAAILIFSGVQSHQYYRYGQGQPQFSAWNAQIFFGVTIAILAIVGFGSAYKTMSLSAGGSAVSELMGGRLINSNTNDPNERKLLNVVEEMSIASGVPMPQVYVMDEENGINAFAAGHKPGDATVTVTSGCMRLLTRDELQGVIGHEFSHILNGDMRLNLRLMGIIFGILCMAIIGRILLQTMRGGGRRGQNPLPLLGIVLLIVGYIGVFFGRLIQAAVSRQREFLADASAVQFTRNPDGIAGALKKIGALSEGSRVRAPEAQEASHLFFGDAVGHFLGIFATHPPLIERIRRIDPAFEGDFSRVRVGTVEPHRTEDRTPTTLRPRVGPGREGLRFSPTRVVSHIGMVEPQQLAYASAVLTSLPGPLKTLAYEPFGARALVFALLIDQKSEAVRAAQLQRLATYAEPALRRQVEEVLPLAHSLTPELRLPLVSMVVPTLRRLSRDQFESFAAGIRELIQADNDVSLYEYAMHRLLLRYLAPHYGYAPPSRSPVRSASVLIEPVRHVLGALAHIGSAQPADAARAFAMGIQALGWPEVDPSLPPRNLDLQALDQALDVLDAAVPLLKRQILGACAACIGADGRVTVEEGELLRAVADALGCPVPPLQSLAGTEAAGVNPLE
jgi:Zn-dependent protease with chaperone function